MKILLLGNTGQVGWELNRTLLTLGELIALDYPQLNMADAKSIQMIVRETKPNIIVNATAYTNVDKAESEPELAEAINGVGPGILAEEAFKLGAALIHYSTDFVFDGAKGEPYTEEDQPNPINQYGISKLHGEQAIQQVGGTYLIFRTSWVYSLHKDSFITKVMQWALEQQTLRIVNDQIGSPTWARMLAEVTAQIITLGMSDPIGYIKEKANLYHLAGEGSCSRYEWARTILEFDSNKNKHISKELIQASISDFPTRAKRPINSSLQCLRIAETFPLFMVPWKKLLKLAMSP